MTDPLSLIAAGAAIGGLASKVVEKTWDSGERWLREKFGSYAAEGREQALENSAKFVYQLAMRVESLEKNCILKKQSVFKTQSDPQFLTFLKQTVLNSAKTSDEKKHDLLARLVADRLASRSETTLALASDLASDAITRSTNRQLELMSVCCFLDEIRPRDQIKTVDDYHLWLSIHLSHFVNFEFAKVDARHLVAIACATFDPASNRSLPVLLMFKAGIPLMDQLIEDDFKKIPNVDILLINWDSGLADVQLTSVGSIVGGLALGQIMGKDFGPPDWK
jgi:hypothetical protein